jgi:hypothetical protein
MGIFRQVGQSSTLSSYNRPSGHHRDDAQIFTSSDDHTGFCGFGVAKCSDDCSGTLGRRPRAKHLIDPALGLCCRASWNNHHALLHPRPTYGQSILLVRSGGNWNLDSLLRPRCMAHSGGRLLEQKNSRSRHIKSIVVKRQVRSSALPKAT